MSKKIGLLDFGYFNPDNNNSIELINFTFEFVKKLEELNFSRYWMAEHYNDYCSWTNPEILLTILAGMTQKIRIGAAGILIYYHSPFQIASSFKMISSLFPNRIDLGLARGDVHPHMIKHLIGTNKLPKRVFIENEKKILKYLYDHKIYDKNDNMIPIPPYGGGLPTAWTLGTSRKSALRSIDLDTNFSLSLFHERQNLTEFRDIWIRFSEEKVKRNKKSLLGNVAIQYTSISNLKKLKKFSKENKVTYNNNKSLKIIGEPNYCEDKLNRYFEFFGCDEIIIHDLSRDFEQRIENIESLSKFTLNFV